MKKVQLNSEVPASVKRMAVRMAKEDDLSQRQWITKIIKEENARRKAK